AAERAAPRPEDCSANSRPRRRIYPPRASRSILVLAVGGVRSRRPTRRSIGVYLTKKHLSRRAVLKGAGVAVALPLLDAMIPAATALAQTAAAPKLRAGFFYIPHGAIMWNTSHGKEMDHWTPSGSNADFKLSPIMEPLEKFK